MAKWYVGIERREAHEFEFDSTNPLEIVEKVNSGEIVLDASTLRGGGLPHLRMAGCPEKGIYG